MNHLRDKPHAAAPPSEERVAGCVIWEKSWAVVGTLVLLNVTSVLIVSLHTCKGDMPSGGSSKKAVSGVVQLGT